MRWAATTAELRNLPHIASMAFNEPLMLEPAYARVFFCALAGQLGISRLTDAVSGDSLTAGEAPAALALSGDDDGPRQARSYQVMNGIAVLPVSGTLVSRTRALQPYSGMTGYNGIIARLQQAASDPMVDGILLDMDTPGGMVAGAFDCADIIARVRDIKPVWALTKETQSTTVSATASQADVTDVVPATEGENASAAQPDVNAQITSAVAAENSRIMGILNCEEAHGREEQARVLAETPGMTVETARRILAAAPQSAQARSDTALDRLMQGAPAPLAAGMSYSKRGSNALIKFDYTDTLQIKYANHGSTMTLNTQGTAYAGVTAQLWGNSSRPVVYEVGVDGGAYMFYAQKTTSNTYELTVNGACNASAFNQGSDRDLKDNIQVIDNAIDRIRKMNGYTYTLKENGMPYAGVIAQETLEAIPEAVGSMMKYPDGGSGLDGEEGERYYTVDYSGVTGLLVQVARESDDRITALEEENAELRQRLSAIEAALASK